MATIFPPNAQISDEFQGYRFNGVAWKIIGSSLTTEYLTRQEADLLYAPLQDLNVDGGDSSAYTPVSIIDGGQSEVDFVDQLDANAA